MGCLRPNANSQGIDEHALQIAEAKSFSKELQYAALTIYQS